MISAAAAATTSTSTVTRVGLRFGCLSDLGPPCGPDCATRTPSRKTQVTSFREQSQLHRYQGHNENGGILRHDVTVTHPLKRILKAPHRTEGRARGWETKSQRRPLQTVLCFYGSKGFRAVGSVVAIGLLNWF